MNDAASETPRRRFKKGSWLSNLLPEFRAYRSIEPGKRAAFLSDLASRTGLVDNTLWRQFAAMSYLVDRRVSLERFGDQAPALLSVEAVARVSKLAPELEAKLLDDLLEGKGTVASFRNAAKTAAAERRPQKQALPEVPTRFLSDVLLEHYSHAEIVGGWGDWIDVEMWPDRPLMPLMHIRQGAMRFALLLAEHDGPMAGDEYFPRLFEGTVLRSLAMCDRVVICSDMVLVELESTLRVARKTTSERAVLLRCRLVKDLLPPPRDARFRTIEAFVESHRTPRTTESAC